MLSNFKIKISYFILCGLFCCCSETNERFIKPSIERSFILAGKNKKELIKVLEYYKKDSLGLRAAEFLIINMPNHFSSDTTYLKNLRPIYKIIKNSDHEKLKELESKNIEKWEDAKKSINHQKINTIEDIKVVTSDYLIKNIDFAIKAWKTNPYSKENLAFNDFCKTILPYRKKENVSLENWREYFFKKHNSHFYKSYPSIFHCIDSLSIKYRDNQWGNNSFLGLSFLKYQDLLDTKKSTCAYVCWLNEMIFAANGIPIVTDFVPYWGNRNNNHSWNALFYKNRVYSFDPFYNKGSRWKDLYNNSGERKQDSRAPKVFRKSYASFFDKPLLDKRVEIENIPPLFQDSKKEDVSKFYFDTYDVEVKLDFKVLKNTYYSYLSVFNYGSWKPVAYSEIEENMSKYLSMGAGIVYLPGYYKQGEVVAANYPFYLTSNGHKKHFIPSSNTHTIKIHRKHPLSLVNKQRANKLKSTVFLGSEYPDFRNEFLLLKIANNDKDIPSKMNYMNIKTNKKIKYLKILVSKSQDIAELEFYSGNKLLKIKSIINEGKNDANKLFDRKINNFFSFNKSTGNIWLGVEFEESFQIDKIGFCPRNDSNHIEKDDMYELLYFNKDWMSLGKKNTDTGELIYDDVPKNALLWLRNLTKGNEERIFSIENNKQVFY